MSSTLSTGHGIVVLPDLELRVEEGLLTVDSVPAGRDAAEAVRVIASGELDLCSAPVLAHAIRQAADRSAVIDLDLAGVTFIDSQGLHLLLTLQDLAGRGRARVASCSVAVERLFATVGLPIPA